MWHLLFHRWFLTRCVPSTRDRTRGWWDDWGYTEETTNLHFVCASNYCHKTKVKTVIGRWTLDDFPV